MLFYSPQTLAKENVLINFKRNYKNDKDISRKFKSLVIYLTQTPNSRKKIYNITRIAYNLVSTFHFYTYNAPPPANTSSTSSSADAKIGTILAIFQIYAAPCSAGGLRYCAIIQKGAGSIPDGVNTSDSVIALGVDSAPNRNEYQEYFLGINVVGM
jgi:hypothetical protein